MPRLIALSLCLTLAGCAHNAADKTQTSEADASWWPFSKQAPAAPATAASAPPASPAAAPAPASVPTSASAAKAQAPVAKTQANAPAVKAQAPATKVQAAAGKVQAPVAKAQPPAPAPAAVTPVAVEKAVESETLAEMVTTVPPAKAASSWWWPFGNSPAKPAAAKVVPLPPVAETRAWLDNYEPRLREAIKGSRFELERRDNLLVVTAPVDSAFNPDRPSMLLPVTLGPFSRVAKLVEQDKQIAIFILGHADSTGAATRNRELSQERAKAVTAIFRLSGLKRDRLMAQGLGSDMPRAANDSVQGRALNRRVEILLSSPQTMRALIARYNQPVPVTQVVAADQAK
ncbi:MAG: OmpA family protein [Pseudomonas sp.]|uniref:OmpA family protein n=1 Tax=Pseudomonas sp. TaxID=306 RepID=UPI00339A5676